MKYCSNCGNPMQDDMLFCQQCGTKFIEPVAEPPEEDPPAPEPHEPTVTPIEEVPEPPIHEKKPAMPKTKVRVVEVTPHNQKKTQKKLKLWVLLAVYLLLSPTTNWYLPIVVGFFGVPICLLLLIIYAIKKKKKRNVLIALVFMLVSLIVGAILAPSSEEQAAMDCEKDGHTYTEEISVAATCKAGGKVTFTCSRCGDSYTEDTPLGDHSYTDEIIEEATCTEAGELKRTCTVCGVEVAEAIEAAHTWENATCTTPKTCQVCGITDGTAYGHTTDAGICETCSARVEKLSPVTFVGMRYTIDYVGGVEWTFKLRNNTDKEIKYITFQWNCYNAVDDPIRDEITNKEYVRIKFTGPLGPGETTDKKRNTTLFYNNTYDHCRFTEITVEYMDGTTESVNEYYYGFSE